MSRLTSAPRGEEVRTYNMLPLWKKGLISMGFAVHVRDEFRLGDGGPRLPMYLFKCRCPENHYGQGILHISYPQGFYQEFRCTNP